MKNRLCDAIALGDRCESSVTLTARLVSLTHYKAGSIKNKKQDVMEYCTEGYPGQG